MIYVMLCGCSFDLQASQTLSQNGYKARASAHTCLENSHAHTHAQARMHTYMKHTLMCRKPFRYSYDMRSFFPFFDWMP